MRRIETLASPEEQRWLQTEFVRLLLKADMRLTQRKMAEEMGKNIPDAEDELEKVAVEWTDNFAP